MNADILIGTLSILVTILMGWNVFNVIDFKGRMKNIIKNELFEIYKGKEQPLYLYTFKLANLYSLNGKLDNAIILYIQCLNMVAGDEKRMNTIIYTMKYYIYNKSVDKDSIKFYINQLNRINNEYYNNNLSELIDKLRERL